MSDKQETHHLHTLPVDGFLGLAFERAGEAGMLALAGKDDQANAEREAQRRELIQRSRQGEQIELVLTAQTYAQKDGEPNRRYIEFSPRALQTMAKSAPGTPFLRDHWLFSTDSSGGFAVATKLERDEDGMRRLVEDIRLVTPWAVQAALEGRMRKFSIGIEPLGDVRATLKCLGCGKLVAECRHYPGQKIETRAGTRVSIWQHADAAIVERSWVLYPAVDQTGPENIRQFMAYYMGGPSMGTKSEDERGTAADTGQASQNHDHEREALAAMVQDLTTQLTAAQKRIEELEAKSKTSEEDKQAQAKAAKGAALGAAIDELCKSGQLLPNGAQEKAIRAKLDAGDLDGAQALVDFAKASPRVSPAGAPRQSPGSGGHALPRTGDGKIDFQAVFQSLPDHLRAAAGSTFARNPEPFIRANRAHIARHGIDLSALDL